MKTIVHEVLAGSHINEACSEAVALAKAESCTVKFTFNEQELTATPETDPAALANHYMAESKRIHDEYVASPEYKARREAAEKKERARQEAMNLLLKEGPEHMTLRDADGWKKACENNKDAYGNAVMTYAERWARLMEVRMGQGELIGAIADECSHLADTEGITGFMYGCAVNILAHVWIHGEALRLWHNLKTQIGDEGKKANDAGTVLNPAVITIGKE